MTRPSADGRETHIAWDRGAIGAAISQVLGAGAATATAPKTTKTLCDRRVPAEQVATEDAATCVECRGERDRWDAETARETEEFEARMRELTPAQVANLL